jgi:hypothetical protein
MFQSVKNFFGPLPLLVASDGGYILFCPALESKIFIYMPRYQPPEASVSGS